MKRIKQVVKILGFTAMLKSVRRDCIQFQLRKPFRPASVVRGGFMDTEMGSLSRGDTCTHLRENCRTLEKGAMSIRLKMRVRQRVLKMKF